MKKSVTLIFAILFITAIPALTQSYINTPELVKAGGCIGPTDHANAATHKTDVGSSPCKNRGQD
jgi:hypothetical protein